MDMASLFPAAALAPHVSFKAGRLTRDEATNLVTADARKGVFQIVTTPDELMHLQWRPRGSAPAEDDLTDLIMIPGNAVMEKVRSAGPDARVYVVKLGDLDTRLFFWMQGTDTAEDDALVASVNRVLQGGPQQEQVS